MVQRMGGKLFVTCDSIEVRGDASISVNSTTKYRNEARPTFETRFSGSKSK